VARNQRARIHGATIEAVSRSGYQSASVKQVITLAGVSRRSFYEQFANKQECFLATFDLIAARELRRMRGAYLTSEGELEPRLRAVLEAYLGGARDEPKALRLMLIDAAGAGEPGLARICRAAGAHEQLLGECFLRGPRPMPLPGPLLRALTGGLQGVLAARILAGPLDPIEPLCEQLLGWALSFRGPPSARMNQWLERRLRTRMRAISREVSASGRENCRPLHAAEPAGDERTKILEAALSLAARHGHHELTVPLLADAAGITIERFFACFASCEECVSTAQAMVGERLVAIAEDPRLRGDGWEQAVRPVLGALLAHLAARPLHARALVQHAFCLGEETTRSSFTLASQLATLLTAGAPAESSSPLAGEAAVAGLWHTIRCLLVGRRMQLLPALTDHLSFVLLAPTIGAGPALEALRQDDALTS
jgi:AcrR family transcriptional regulator